MIHLSSILMLSYQYSVVVGVRAYQYSVMVGERAYQYSVVVGAHHGPEPLVGLELYLRVDLVHLKGAVT